MSLPPVPYDRLFNFETFSTTNPTVQQPGVQIDGELDALKITVDSVISRLSEIQRSDGKLNPQAFESTGIPEAIATQSYSQVYAQLQPLVSAAAQSAIASSTSATVAGNHANAAQAHATAANAAIAPAVAAKDIAVTKATEAQTWAGQANAAASTAASAEVEAEAARDQAIVARNGAEQALSSVSILKNNIDNQYGNLLDADQNLDDVSSKSQAINNLGLDVTAMSDVALFNRFKSMFHMYVDPNEGDWTGVTFDLSISNFLRTNFGLVFNDASGLFVLAEPFNNFGTYLGQGIDGMHEDSTLALPGSNQEDRRVLTLAHRRSVLLKRMSIMASIMRNSMLRIKSSWGYNGDNRLITLQDFQSAQGPTMMAATMWGVVAQKVNDSISNWWAQTDAPDDGKQYARKNLTWTEVAASGGGVSQYDNFKIYSANDVVWLGSFIYRFNSTIGAAGYGPITHPSAWTKLSASQISDIFNLQNELNARATNTALTATNTALTSGLAGKANTSHTHIIANVTGLQTALNGKANLSHSHNIFEISGWAAQLEPYERRALPVVYGNYNQTFFVNTPGSLHIIDYASDNQGKVQFQFSNTYGERYNFYQSVNAAYPVQFLGAINIDNKTFTRGAKSFVTAINTADGWVVSGDLMFPPSGTLLSSGCQETSQSDALGQSWTGYFNSVSVYADGNGGTYTSGGINQNGCWYPNGFCLQTGIETSSSTLSWSGCSSSGTYKYAYSFADLFADGAGSTYTGGNTGGWSASYGDTIYDSLNSCVVKYDGMGGYFVQDNSGGGNPSYGTYLGYFSGTSQFSYYSSNTGNSYSFDSYYWAEDRYADGMGYYYVTNNNISYVSHGTYLGYVSDDNVGIYADGNGSYYTSY
jgi:hypothetical protein